MKQAVLETVSKYGATRKLKLSFTKPHITAFKGLNTKLL